MDWNIAQDLFDIPSTAEFPIELCHHLKEKLHSTTEQNWHLRRHVDYLDKEVLELRKLRVEKNNSAQLAGIQIKDEHSLTSSVMAAKIVELSKKNRDMTAHVESLKTKVKRLQVENDELKGHTTPIDDEEDKTLTDSIAASVTQDLESAAHASQVANKLAHYRRQSQQLRIELKLALRALAQEVGDNATPQNVLATVSNVAWRGRQQQILNLQQKLSDMQIKLESRQKSECTGENDSSPDFDYMSGGDCQNSIRSSKIDGRNQFTGTNVFPSHRQNLIQQDLKKQEVITKLTSEIEQNKGEMRARQQELKACKARTSTLESQCKTLKCQLELAEAKMQDKEAECKLLWNDLNQLKQELIAVRDKEKRNSDKNIIELEEANRAVNRERSIVQKLQEVVSEKQAALEKTEAEVIQMRNKLELVSVHSGPDGLNALEKIQELERQINQITRKLDSSETENRRLQTMIDMVLLENDKEREKVLRVQKDASKAFTVLQEANKCIDECLEAAQVTDTEILEKVEHVRMLTRELKTGNLSCMDKNSGIPGKNLRVKVELLNKEVQVLQNQIRELTDARKRDLKKFSRTSLLP